MTDFPVLKTGAVLQYPAERSVRFSTQVVRFVDGAEQRYRGFGRPLRRWQIRLDLLDESEMTRLREFFREQRGAAGSFRFSDPWDGTDYADCSLENDEMIEELLGEMRGRTTLMVRENRV
jgi:phage-related protein